MLTPRLLTRGMIALMSADDFAYAFRVHVVRLANGLGMSRGEFSAPPAPCPC